MDSMGRKFGGLWQPVGAVSPAPPNKKSPGPGGLDPGVLEAWRLGSVVGSGLLTYWLAVWLAFSPMHSSQRKRPQYLVTITPHFQ